MDSSRDRDDDLWKALAHATRRRILDLLFESPQTTGELVSALGLDRHLVLAHLAVLREAELVLTEKRGRYRVNSINDVPIQLIHQRWVAPSSGPWAAAVIAVRDEAESAVRRAARPEDDTLERKRSG